MVTGPPQRSRFNSITAFDTRGKGGLVDGRRPLPIVLGPQKFIINYFRGVVTLAVTGKQ